jgi:glycosyltransferase involved in cell wall biosynthesis
MGRPPFSVLITTYNRARLVERCVRSCLAQTLDDFEVVVVDDGSSDGTAQMLAALEEPRLRVIRHERNRGYVPARATAVAHARGEWVVMVDSDDELLPHALARLREVIDQLPAGVKVIRSRLRCDDGTIEPEIMPDSPLTDYEGRLRWCDAVIAAGVATDAGHCMHRSVFERTPLFNDRRGAIDTLWELNLARVERSLWIDDVLGLVHFDAPNSYGRAVRASALVPQLLADARDSLWMAETLLREHAPALERLAPHYRADLIESAALHAFLCGNRRLGLRHARAALAAGRPRWRVLGVSALGMIGPRALAYAKVASRTARARRQRGR